MRIGSRNRNGTETILAGLMLTLLLGLTTAQAQENYQRVYSARTQQYVYIPVCQQCPAPQHKATTHRATATPRRSSYSPPKKHKSLESKIVDGFHDIWRSPSIRNGLLGVGAGVGAAALTERNLLRGGIIGAGVGIGTGAMDESYYFKRHPFVRRTSKGALIGLGAAAVTSAAALLPAAAVGAGIGAGVHYLKTH